MQAEDELGDVDLADAYKITVALGVCVRYISRKPGGPSRKQGRGNVLLGRVSASETSQSVVSSFTTCSRACSINVYTTSDVS